MFPNNTETWIFLIVACVVGFGMGQWLKSRKNKKAEYLDGLKRMALAENSVRTKKAKKKKQNK
jgi:hypothetical protein